MKTQGKPQRAKRPTKSVDTAIAAKRAKWRASTQRWREAHREILRERQRRYYAKNAKRIIAAEKRKRAANPEPEKQRQLKWREKNRERLRQKAREWRKANPRKVKARDRRRHLAEG